ncbi:MAG: cell division protein ZapB [Acidobacteriia bacterium]|nr:cell division protein ZapB [Terriglobia bacterium]
MTEKNSQLELTGLERFGHLEDKIFRVVEAFKAIRQENETLQAENQKLKNEMEALRQNEAGYSQNLAQLQKEREALRERVEKALSLLATLEVR